MAGTPDGGNVPPQAASDVLEKASWKRYFEVFDFGRNLLGVLAAVFAVPIVSQGLGLLQAPPLSNEVVTRVGGEETKLTLMSSLLSLLVFGACTLCRPLIEQALAKKNRILRATPTIVSLCFVVVAVTLTAVYLDALNSDTQTYALVALYLSVFPTLMVPLAILMIGSYALQQGDAIQRYLERDLDEREFDVATALVGSYARIRQSAKSEASNKIVEYVSKKVVDDATRQLRLCAEGRIEVYGASIAEMQALVLKGTEDRFDAVSDSDLDFWQAADNQIVTDYLKLTNESMARDVTVTRVFIVNAQELASDALAEVLHEHASYGVRVAVALFDNVKPLINALPGSLDFALFDSDKAVSFFRTDGRQSRRFYAVLKRSSDTKDESSRNGEDTGEIAEQRRMYVEIVTRSWMATRGFTKGKQRSAYDECDEEHWVVDEKFKRGLKYECIQLQKLLRGNAPQEVIESNPLLLAFVERDYEECNEPYFPLTIDQFIGKEAFVVAVDALRKLKKYCLERPAVALVSDHAIDPASNRSGRDALEI